MTLDSGTKPADELDTLVGSTVAGKYHIDRLIGRGGMGAVFQATHAAIGKRVALKFLGAHTARDRDAAARFQREAMAASLAESPHIVQIFDSGLDERGLPFLVMELLTGEDLRARLRREGRLDAETTVAIAAQVLKALREAHAAGIVHRDLKPDNVFLCRRDGEPSFVKLVDFGISKLQERAGVDTLTHEGAVLGTAFYMSPEQAQSFPDIDGRTDLFSVGAIMYEMLVGEPPHSGRTYEAVLIAICTRDAGDVRDKAPDVPDALSRVIARALKRDRAERYGSAAEMLADVEAALDDDGARPHRFRSVVLSLVAALGGFALAAYFVARHDTASVEPPSLRVPAAVSPPPQLEPASTTLPSSSPSVSPASSAPVESAASAASKAKPLKKPRAAASSGVAGGLGLSTREP